jgi:hypothetical protein
MIYDSPNFKLPSESTKQTLIASPTAAVASQKNNLKISLLSHNFATNASVSASSTPTSPSKQTLARSAGDELKSMLFNNINQTQYSSSLTEDSFLGSHSSSSSKILQKNAASCQEKTGSYTNLTGRSPVKASISSSG